MLNRSLPQKELWLFRFDCHRQVNDFTSKYWHDLLRFVACQVNDFSLPICRLFLDALGSKAIYRLCQIIQFSAKYAERVPMQCLLGWKSLSNSYFASHSGPTGAFLSSRGAIPLARRTSRYFQLIFN